MNQMDYLIMMTAFALIIERIFKTKAFLYWGDSLLIEIKRKQQIYPLIAIAILCLMIVNSLIKGGTINSLVVLFMVGIVLQITNLMDFRLITEYGILYKDELIAWRHIKFYTWDEGLVFYLSNGDKVMFTEKYEYRNKDLVELLKEVLSERTSDD